MYVEEIHSLKEYTNFYKIVYKNDPAFKDNKSGLIPLVCSKSSAFYKNSIQKMIAIKESNKTFCQCVMIIHKENKGELCIAFFEALPNCKKAVDKMLSFANDFAKQHGGEKIVVGLEGHCNNSLGFSIESNSCPSFGEVYNPHYYKYYFEGFEEITLSSFIDSVNKTQSAVQKDMDKYSQYLSEFTIEQADFSNKGFEKTMKIYTSLGNIIFSKHRGYFVRSYREDFELFGAMRIILKNENLLFIKKGSDYVGFMLWYPDFNELVKPGCGMGIGGFLKYRLLRIVPEKFKVVEIGVLPEYKSKGLMLLPFKFAIDMVLKKYPSAKKIMSSWIFDENRPSILFTKRYVKEIYKEFVLYEKKV